MPLLHRYPLFNLQVKSCDPSQEERSDFVFLHFIKPTWKFATRQTL